MIQLTPVAGGITAPRGFKAAGVKAGIKKSGREDVAVIYSEVPAAAAAGFLAAGAAFLVAGAAALTAAFFAGAGVFFAVAMMFFR